jgi:hypothetical protein
MSSVHNIGILFQIIRPLSPFYIYCESYKVFILGSTFFDLISVILFSIAFLGIINRFQNFLFILSSLILISSLDILYGSVSIYNILFSGTLRKVLLLFKEQWYFHILMIFISYLSLFLLGFFSSLLNKSFFVKCSVIPF